MWNRYGFGIQLLAMSFVTSVINRRRKLGLSQLELSKEANVGISIIRELEQKGKMPKRSNALRLAKFLEIDPPPFEAEPPPGIAPMSTADATQTPEWTITTSASRWTPAPICELDYDDPYQRQVINTGRFRLRIDGDCMEPQFPDGSSVEFVMVKVDADGLEIGADYVLCRSDCTATFKQLRAVSDEELTLGARNQKKYPGEFTISRQEIVRMAKVNGVVQPPPAPVVVKLRKG